MGLNRKGFIAKGGIVTDVGHAVIGPTIDNCRDGIYTPLGDQFINELQICSREAQESTPPVFPFNNGTAYLIVSAQKSFCL